MRRMFRISRPAAFAITLVIVATVGSEIATIAIYRDSTDGQTPVLWIFIVLYGLLAIGVIKLIDSAARLLRHRSARR